eukprot:scaffold48685_cov46-Attheya_sp.AAC.4
MTDDKRPGVARFTKWNEAATFVPLESPTDDVSLEQEEMLKQKWKESCVAPKPTMFNQNTDDWTAGTAPMSLEEARRWKVLCILIVILKSPAMLPAKNGKTV